MAYNFANLGNQTLENMLPLFNNIANMGATSTLSANTNFINQLAAAITNASAKSNASSCTPMTSKATTSTTMAIGKREKTPEPPPAPIFSTFSPPKMKPNQGSAVPMDLENDAETDSTATGRSTTSSQLANAVLAASKTNAEKMTMNIQHDPNLYLNGLLSAGINPTAGGYMFFPTPTNAAAASGATGPTTNAMLMDPTAMMAAAMQQMHHSYANYALPDSGGSNGGGVIDGNQLATDSVYATTTVKEVIKTKSCILFPPNSNAPPPTIRERPPGCRTVFVGGLPENISEEIIREIFETCGEFTTLRMSKKNFCHIRYRHEASIDRAIFLSGYRLRISNSPDPTNFGRLHVDYAQARDDQYDFECKQRQLQREQRHRERMSLNRVRSQSPPPMPHYTDHEASLVAESLRNNDTFVKAIQTITAWLERGDCNKRNANMFYSMIQSTHAHVRRLHTDKLQLEDDLRKARESYRKQMLIMSKQFTQIEKVFSAASHKKVWDHFSKAQRKNIDQWKKLASELRSIQIEDDEMEMSDDDRYDHSSSHAKRSRYDSDGLKEENDSLRCQLEAMRNEMSLERTDIKCSSDFREKQIKVLQETIRNMQTQLLQTNMREQKDAKIIEQLERKLKESGVRQLLLKTKIREIRERSDQRVGSTGGNGVGEPESSRNSDTSECLIEESGVDTVTSASAVVDTSESKAIANETNDNHDDAGIKLATAAAKDLKQIESKRNLTNAYTQIIDIDVYKSDDDVKIIDDQVNIVEIHEDDDDDDNDDMKNVSIEKSSDTEKKKYNENHMLDELKNGQKLEETPKERKEINSLALLEAKIIALTAAYLVVQPFGVSINEIACYLNKMIPTDDIPLASKLNEILGKYRNIFQTDDDENIDATAAAAAAAAGGGISTKWIFCGFHNDTIKIKKNETDATEIASKAS